MKKNNSSFIHIGFSSIVMVFIMICLVTFATLSVLTAHSDYRLSKKMAEKTTAYYDADAIARNMLKNIDNNLYDLYQNTHNATQFFEELAFTNMAEDAPVGIYDFCLETGIDSAVISYATCISDVQTLCITLKINYPSADSECFSTITRWQTITENQPEDSEEYLNLYTGNE